ncbi:MAG: hypothetical protein AEth_01769 [Candidatus Argoarchaeum ethanivorans]|uniref:Uncharacterized protein n=1 Tax=Candidatus Argoarchaeum ethanivorans TaxID=2608793 RepID=A0A8B3RYL2_9EURY|nr:MAG: hypothetical protein AEth_01769 [Candidatus Argoarchaeum ethanivorans]
MDLVSVVEKAVWNAVHSFEDLGVKYKEGFNAPHKSIALLLTIL